MTTPGVLIAGRYRLRTRIASGGMGSVWVADDEVLGRRVAVKLLLPQPGTSAADAETARNRVIREARITARLHHPHAVTLYDVVQHAGQPCLIMQYVPSRSLNAVLQERGVLPQQRVARIGAEVAAALAAAHLAGIVHRDVKPSNVLITDDGSAKLTDFGISHAAGDVSLTSTGMVSGTPAYLAPEVARGAPSGFPADVFSLGATLYAALEGAPPFGTELNPMAILHRVASGTIIPPRRSGSLTPLLLHMLAPMAAYRPTMSDVATALAGAAGGAGPGVDSERPTTSLPPPTVREWPPQPARSEPARSGGSLSDSLLGARHLPDPPGSPVPIGPGGGAVTRTPRRGTAIGATLVIALVALVALGVILFSHRSGTPGVVASTPPAAGGAVSSAVPMGSTPAPIPSRTAQVVPQPVSTARSNSAPTTPRSSRAPSRPENTSARPRALSTLPMPTPTPTPSSTSSSSSTLSSSSTRSAATSSSATSPGASTGAPTAGQLATAVTDYYAELPAGTDDGWAHLTPNFQTTIARHRQYYQAFWDGIESVSVSNARGTAPGTVDATLTYRLKNGETSVELTRYQLVRSDGTLKIDSSAVISSQ